MVPGLKLCGMTATLQHPPAFGSNSIPKVSKYMADVASAFVWRCMSASIYIYDTIYAYPHNIDRSIYLSLSFVSLPRYKHISIHIYIYICVDKYRYTSHLELLCSAPNKIQPCNEGNTRKHKKPRSYSRDALGAQRKDLKPLLKRGVSTQNCRKSWIYTFLDFFCNMPVC